jgi:DUF4097 and DUF4098 domain-containing protein YvlB
VTYEFETETPPRLAVRVPAGRVDVTVHETSRTLVEVEAIRGDVDDVRVEQRGDEIVVEVRNRLGFRNRQEYEVRIQAPLRARLALETAAARVETRGALRAAEVKSASGEVSVEQVDEDVSVRSASGDVALGSVGGRVDVNTASGAVDVRSAGGDVVVRTASGDVRLGQLQGDISVQTASGDQRLDAVSEGSLDLRSASGDVRIGIRVGSRLYVDVRSLSGKTSSEVALDPDEPESGEDGPLVRLKAATMSGDIAVVRA